MKKKEFAESLKGKTVAALLKLLKLGQTGESKIDPDFLGAVIDELNSRELSESEANHFEKLMDTSEDEPSSLKIKSKIKFSEEEINEISIDKDKDSEPARYTGLKTISTLISILGYIVIIIGIVGLFYLANENQTLMGFTTLVVSLIISIPLLAFSNLISVFIDIEQNTRKTRELLKETSK